MRTGTTTTYGIGISWRMRLISSDGSHPGGLPIPRMKSSRRNVVEFPAMAVGVEIALVGHFIIHHWHGSIITHGM